MLLFLRSGVFGQKGKRMASMIFSVRIDSVLVSEFRRACGEYGFSPTRLIESFIEGWLPSPGGRALNTVQIEALMVLAQRAGIKAVQTSIFDEQQTK